MCCHPSSAFKLLQSNTSSAVTVILIVNYTIPCSSLTQVAPGIPAKSKRPPSGTLPEWGFTWYSNLTYGENTSINPFFYGTYLGVTKKEEPGESVAR